MRSFDLPFSSLLSGTKPAARLPVLLLLLTLAGCAAKEAPDHGPIFWPLPPDEPRIQYLTGFSNAEDLDASVSLTLVSLTGRTEAASRIDKPFGLAVGRNKIYVSDTPKGKVWIIDLEKRALEPLAGNFSLGKLSKPVNLALDAGGNLFVADTERKEVLVYDPAGKYVTAYGPRQGLDMKPVDVAIDGERLFVADIGNSEIKILDRRNGKLLGVIKGEAGQDGVSIPLSLAVGPKGVIHLTNLGTGRLLRFDRDGHLLGAFGRLGNNFGAFARPRGIDVDEQGRIFVVDAGHGNCQVFLENGQLLLFFGDPGTPGGSMTLPAAVVVTTENLDYFRKYAAPGFELEQLIYVTNQYSRHAKVGVYGMGRMHGWSRSEDALPALAPLAPAEEEAVPPAAPADNGAPDAGPPSK